MESTVSWVKPDDPAALADAISSLLENRQGASKLENSATHASTTTLPRRQQPAADRKTKTIKLARESFRRLAPHGIHDKQEAGDNEPTLHRISSL